ncbi:MAG: TRAP transporter small permease, partial [Chloroflexota bacterium]
GNMAQAWRRFSAFIERLNTYLALAGGTAAFLMFAIITYDVFMRYFFIRPTRWALDLGEMLMLPAIYLPAAFLLREGGHIRVDILIGRIKGRRRAVMELATYLIGLLWGLLIVWQSWLIFTEFVRRGKVSQIAQIPLYPAIFFIVLGSAFLVVEFLIRIVDGVIAVKEGKVPEVTTEEVSHAH